MYSVQCTENYSVQCTVYSVQCTVYSVQCTVYSVQCTVYSVQYTLYYTILYYTIYYTILYYTIQCTVPGSARPSRWEILLSLRGDWGLARLMAEMSSSLVGAMGV